MALLMNVLLGISPRLFSICFNSDIGRVIPSFSVLSAAVVLTIPLYLIILSYKRFLPLYLQREERHRQNREPKGSGIRENSRIIVLKNNEI